MQLIISEDSATPALEALIVQLDQKMPFFATLGRRVTRAAQAGAKTHSQGGSFWLSIANATRVQAVDNNGVTIGCNHYAAAQKQYGGTIRPVKAQALTIPIVPEAEGRRAAEWTQDLFIPKGSNILGYSDGTGVFHGLYALVKSVTQKAEPWWPSEDEVAAMAAEEAEFWLSQ